MSPLNGLAENVVPVVVTGVIAVAVVVTDTFSFSVSVSVSAAAAAVAAAAAAAVAAFTAFVAADTNALSSMIS